MRYFIPSTNIRNSYEGDTDYAVMCQQVEHFAICYMKPLNGSFDQINNNFNKSSKNQYLSVKSIGLGFERDMDSIHCDI